jgi:peptidylprolyl isomerase
MAHKVQKGDHVTVEYTGTLDDGTEFDSSKNHGPLEFNAGVGQMIQGFDDAVLTMEVGEEKTVTIKAEDAYGQPDKRLIHKVPKESLPEGPTPEAGMMLTVNLPDGNQIPAKIVEVTEKEVTLDLNHPLAGKNLTFKIKVLDAHSHADGHEHH